MSPQETLFPELFRSHPPLLRRALRAALRIDALENLYREARHPQRPLAASILDILNIKTVVADKDVLRIPRSGPVVFVANHPHGFLDGFVLDNLLAGIRPDLKLLVNEMIGGLEAMAGRTIAVDVFAGGVQNIRAGRAALGWLKERKSVLMFPAGEVSHWQQHERRIADGPWSEFAARCARRAQATVIPIFITGNNSLTFLLAGALHAQLRTARLPTELFHKRESTVEIRIGAPVRPQQLESLPVPAAAAYLRARVYMMSYRASGSLESKTPKHSFSSVMRGTRVRRTRIADALPVSDAIRKLQSESKCIVENDQYAVYADQGSNIPLLVRELGRLREVTFRQAGEGTGNALDCDEFDPTFTHLILWHKQSAAIAGSYRLMWTSDLLRGVAGLYTSKLFRYAPEFLARLGPAVELGRSFIVKEHQREILPLFLLWQAIGRCVAQRPEAPVLFGAVSISATYCDAARALMVDLLRQHNFRHDLDALVMPRRPFVSPVIHRPELHTIARCLPDVEDLPLSDIDPQGSVPVLLRQYLRLGGRVAGFNLDRRFSNALDALLILDLRETPRRVLAKYMGASTAEAFLGSLS